MARVDHAVSCGEGNGRPLPSHAQFSAIRKRRLQQLSIGVVVSAGLHLALIGSLRQIDSSTLTSRPQSAISVRMVPERAVAFSPTTKPGAAIHDAAHHQSMSLERRVQLPDQEPSTPAQLALNRLTDIVASDFVPAEGLALRPAATTDVAIPYPDGPEVPGRISVPLTLFIDENGVVVRVWVEDSDLPERFLGAATAAFQNAVFSPGQTATGAVKSKIRLEVTFDVNES